MKGSSYGRVVEAAVCQPDSAASQPNEESSMSTRSTPSATAQPGTSDGTGSSQPIGAYGLLADCNTAALVDRHGSIDWLCLPRYDSPAVFARILDREAGHWSIRPVGGFTTTRQFLPGTLVLE